MTFRNIFLKKIFVNKTKLRYSRQKIINYNNCFETMKNIRKKNVKIYHIYESQKFFAFYNHKTI